LVSDSSKSSSSKLVVTIASISYGLNCCDFKLENSKEERRLIDNLKVDKIVILKSPGKQIDVFLEELSIF